MLKKAEKLAFEKQKALLMKQMGRTFDEYGRLKEETCSHFLRMLSEYIGVPAAVSARDEAEALRRLLRVFSLGEGDAVFLPLMGSPALLREVMDCGAKPIFVPLHPRTYTTDIRALQEAIREVMSEALFRARLILAVDAFGLPCDYPALEKIAARYGLFLFDLASGGAGASLQRQACPGFGDAGILSFAPGCRIAAMQDGAVIFTSNEKIYQALKAESRPEIYEQDGAARLGQNMGLHPLECAYLSEKFSSYRSGEAMRISELASFLSAQLKDLIDPPFVPAGFCSAWQYYVLKLPETLNAEQCQAALAERGIESFLPPWYDLASMYRKLSSAHEHDKLARKAEEQTDFSERLLLLPLHPYMTRKDAADLVSALRELLNEAE